MSEAATEETLSPRRGQILKLVVEEYVSTAQPVSSDALVRKYVPRVSSATVRNELAALEGYGYLYHPHTSSGRVPSDRGYRYYVESLMGGARLGEMEARMISHQFHQIELNVDEWLRLAGAVLSSHVRNPVMIWPPVSRTSIVRHIDFVPIGVGLVLLVVVLQSGMVRQQVLRFPDDDTPESLSDLAREWNAVYVGRSSAEIRRVEPPHEHQQLRRSIIALLDEADREFIARSGDVYISGISYMAAQPEFETRDQFRPVVEALEHHAFLPSLMEPLLQSDGVYVAIGQEQPIEPLRDCAIILATYGRQGDMLGVVGVIGPTRLPYWRTVPMVTYTAGMLDQLLASTFLS
ncbi:MAG TPA: heat-inducible transcriptional repressor HrcA [Chloroflexota bacterium]|nr:heat-inducible transcriptional repressor HrcA [Chloroflexota bacterium]